MKRSFFFAIACVLTMTCGALPPSDVERDERNRPPTVTVVTPESQPLYRGYDTYFAAEASDEDGFVRRVDFFVDGVKIASDETQPFRISFKPAADDDVRVKAVAWDDGGSHATSATAVYKVTECPVGESCAAEVTADLLCCAGSPVVHWVSPKPNERHVAPATIALEVTATGGGGAIAKVEFFANDKLVGTATNPPYRFMWDKVPEGTYFVSAWARPTSGTIGVSAVNTIRVTAR